MRDAMKSGGNRSVFGTEQRNRDNHHNIGMRKKMNVVERMTFGSRETFLSRGICLIRELQNHAETRRCWLLWYDIRHPKPSDKTSVYIIPFIYMWDDEVLHPTAASQCIALDPSLPKGSTSPLYRFHLRWIDRSRRRP